MFKLKKEVLPNYFYARLLAAYYYYYVISVFIHEQPMLFFYQAVKHMFQRSLHELQRVYALSWHGLSVIASSGLCCKVLI